MTDVNGVFKGGGAKGICYVGALEECHRRGLRFRAVAGSSAGAITAALIAAGSSPTALRSLLPDALAQLEPPRRALLAIHRRSLLKSDKLEAWLDRTIAATLAERAAPPIGRGIDWRPTFADVQAATGVVLYVVAMNASSRQPIVFSPDLTPDTPVAAAVAASAAIPVAFPAYRMIVDGELVRLIDGGVWSNYPHFVFHDDDFRAAHDLHDGASSRPTVGFALEDSPATDLTVSRRFAPTSPMPAGRRGVAFTDGGSAARQLGRLGALASSPWTAGLAVATPLIAGCALVFALWRLGADSWGELRRLPGDLGAPAITLVIFVAAFTLPTLLVLASGAARFARSLLDEGLSGASAAMGVGPSVPYWLDKSNTTPGVDRHATIRIDVPDEITTLSFRPKHAVVESAIEAGASSARSAFDAMSPNHTVSGLPPATPTATSTVEHGAVADVLISFFFLMLKAVVFGLVATVVIRQSANGSPFVVVPLVALGVGVLLSISSYGRRRSDRARGRRASLRSVRLRGQLAVLGVTGMFAAVLLILPATNTPTSFEIATSEGPALGLDFYREFVPTSRLLGSETAEGTVLENNVADGQRTVAIVFDEWTIAGCGRPSGSLVLPVGRVLGSGYDIGDSFDIPFDTVGCSFLWDDSGDGPQLSNNIYLAMFGLAALVLAVAVVVAIVGGFIDRRDGARR